MTDGYLTRAEVDHLATQLEHISDIEREMAIALTGQTRPQATGGYTRPQKPGSKPPYPLGLADLLDELKGELVTAVRDISETRGIAYEGAGTLTGCAVWLTRNRFALQLMESGAETFEALCKVIERCRRTMGHIEEDLSGFDLKKAHRKIMTASQIESVARLLGEEGWGLNHQRISRLVHAGKVEPVMVPSDDGDRDLTTYRLGEVLEAHRVTPRRRRGA